jgi:CheY-like chemotaxis protein
MDMEQGIILIVDDNPTNLGVLSEGLSDSGFEVLIAQDGESAIERVDYAHPDIILLDVAEASRSRRFHGTGERTGTQRIKIPFRVDDIP